MREKLLDEEESRVYQEIRKKQEEEADRQSQKRSEPSTDKTESMPSSVWDAPTPSKSSIHILLFLARGSEPSDTPSRSKWGETPSRGKWDQGEKTIGDTPGAKRSRWDETPVSRAYGSSTPGSATPGGPTTLWQQEMAWRNRPLTDEELDQLLPGGYRIVVPPESYVSHDYGDECVET